MAMLTLKFSAHLSEADLSLTPCHPVVAQSRQAVSVLELWLNTFFIGLTMLPLLSA